LVYYAKKRSKKRKRRLPFFGSLARSLSGAKLRLTNLPSISSGPAESYLLLPPERQPNKAENILLPLGKQPTKADNI
jgi:hypothetical protein